MHDVIVIGARCAGSPIALQLARKGYRVLVLDRSTFPSDVLSTHFLWPRGASYLNRWGLLESVLARTPSHTRLGISIENVTLTGEVPRGCLEDRFERLHGESAGVVSVYCSARRRTLDEILVTAAANAGAEVRQGFTAERLLIDGDEVVGIEGRTQAGERVAERASIVVGADGRGSFLARSLGVPTFETKAKCSFAFFSYFSDLPLAHARICKRGRLALGAAPTNDGLTMVLVFGPAEWFDAFRQDPERNFHRAVRLLHPEIADQIDSGARRVEKFYGTADQMAFWRKAYGPGWVLAGDAGCFKDQCTAIGMTHAFRDAALVAEAIDRGLSGQEPMARALDSYAKRRYLDGIDYYNFVCTQAEMNPTRLDELELFEGIAESSAETDRFIAMYGDAFPVRRFLSTRHTEELLAPRPAASTEEYARYERELDTAYRNPFTSDGQDACVVAFSRTTQDFANPPTRHLLERTSGYGRWVDARADRGIWPYTRFLHAAPGPTAPISDERGQIVDGVNFASQDYLALASHPRIHEAARAALRNFGPHSAGSPVVLGNTSLSERLERELADWLQMEHVLLFPTGWAAGYGSIVGLVRPDDSVLLDKYAHACLQAGARAATRHVERHSHLELDTVRYFLEHLRARNARNGILVASEGLFSMDSDWPALERLQELCHEYAATLLVDVAHDLGAMGPLGTGQIGAQRMLGKIDLVMGSFSKTFASNGGFLAARSASVIQYVKMYGGTHMFSNALSPVQTAVILEALEIVRSHEGDRRRRSLFAAIEALRGTLGAEGAPAMGQPSPIVPVLIGHEQVARRAYRGLFARNVGTNMLEFPVVGSGAARFRLQVMASHTEEQAREAGRAVAISIREAQTSLGRDSRRGADRADPMEGPPAALEASL